MRIERITIHDFRGIRELQLPVQAENLVVWGPNGSGKSTVVDAVDFVLTGRIRRLTGPGTGAIHLGQHGPHIDSEPDESWVELVVTHDEDGAPVTLRRSLAQPSHLDVQPPEAKPHISPVLEIAGRGQHILTRREILNYITAEAGDRAQRIQQLLNAGEIEQLRRNLVRLANTAEVSLGQATAGVRTAEGDLQEILNTRNVDVEVLLTRINELRGTLEAEPLGDLDPEAVLPPGTLEDSSGTEGWLSDLRRLARILEPERVDGAISRDTRLASILEAVRADPVLAHAVEHRGLLEAGQRLIDESGACPLCGYEWPSGVLTTKIEERLEAAEAAAAQYKELQQLTTELQRYVGAALVACERLEGQPHGLPLDEWLKALIEARDALQEPLRTYDISEPAVTTAVNASPSAEEIQSAIEAHGGARTESPLQTARDTLVRASDAFKRLERARAQDAAARVTETRARLLLDRFVTARDSVLEELYDGVRDRFVALYKFIHHDDEGDFTAEFAPSGAGVDLTVDFHARGAHPPHALHSEGHQDSMGLCLFLALAERFSQHELDIVILDDVVMSVDAGHRRRISQLLADQFADKQLLITTHDRTWASQLRTDGVVTRSKTLEFHNWSLEAGPFVQGAGEEWDEIVNSLDAGDVPAAAAKLRRTLEQVASQLCEQLEAKVTYKSTFRWDLGELLPSAFGRFKDLLKDGKAVANAHNDEETMQALRDLDSTAGQIYGRTNAEQWAVNAAVHYNSWVNLSPADFRPVLEAFIDLVAVFRCTRCREFVYLVSDGPNPQNLRCRCNTVNINLVR